MVNPQPKPANSPPGIGVAADPDAPALVQSAAVIASDLNLTPIDLSNPPPCCVAALVLTDHRLELRVLRGDRALVGGKAVACDLTAIDTTSGPGRSLGQPLLKAVGIKRRDPYRPSVLDATAGLGEDAWILASLGCTVRAIERNPVTWSLFTDGLRRAAETEPDVVDRMTLEKADSLQVLQTLTASTNLTRPDVVYLDPMFPLGRKTAERKAMRVLRLLSGDDSDAGDLLNAALGAASRRVVVKRPIRADPLPGPSPAVCHKGKSLRFDVYPVRLG